MGGLTNNMNFHITFVGLVLNLLMVNGQSSEDAYTSPEEVPIYGSNDAVSTYQASDAGADPLSALASSIPGVPGEDYPIYSEVPETGFACDGQMDGGYYADPEAECQVFHICTADGAGGLAKYSFLCPNGTLFNQNYFVCDWWFNFDCSTAEDLYSLNDEIAAEREALSGQASDAVGSYQSPANDAYDAPLDASYDAPPAAYGDGARTGRRLGGRSGQRGGRRQRQG